MPNAKTEAASKDALRLIEAAAARMAARESGLAQNLEEAKAWAAVMASGNLDAANVDLADADAGPAEAARLDVRNDSPRGQAPHPFDLAGSARSDWVRSEAAREGLTLPGSLHERMQESDAPTAPSWPPLKSIPTLPVEDRLPTLTPGRGLPTVKAAAAQARPAVDASDTRTGAHGRSARESRADIPGLPLPDAPPDRPSNGPPKTSLHAPLNAAPTTSPTPPTTSPTSPTSPTTPPKVRVAEAAAAAGPVHMLGDTGAHESLVVGERFDALEDTDATSAVFSLTSAPDTPLPLTYGPSAETSLPSVLRAGEGAAADVPAPQFGRYQVLHRLGRGGMATVYRAHDPSIGRDVAIKFLRASLAKDEDCHARFLREARAAGGLSHPNIVVVHDVGDIDGRPYMAMELLDGQALSERVEGGTQMPAREVVQIGLQLARALEYAHARGIVHRDIKPGNIMLLAGSDQVKVTDFGIAQMDDGTSPRTHAGAVLGTPQYMSPEQTRGDKLDGRSDLFAVGIVMYQMLAGQRPFRGDNVVAVGTRIASEAPAPLEDRRDDLPKSLVRVVQRLLAKAPGDRFQSGGELARALLRVRTELDEAAQERASRRVVPLRLKWALMVAGLVAVVMFLTSWFITDRQRAAVMAQVNEHGASLARFVAAQNASNVLLEEWDVVEAAVQEVMASRNFERVLVIDRGGVVRASSLPELIDRPYASVSLGGETLGTLPGGIAARRYLTPGGSMLAYEAPIRYQDKLLGRAVVGVAEAPLTELTRLSLMLMVLLAVITVAAVAVAAYAVASWFARPIRTLSDAMGELAQGHLEHRIATARNDEFGLLFQGFDRMAAGLQRRLAAAQTAGGEGLTEAAALLPTPRPVGSAPAAKPAVQPLGDAPAAPPQR